jgi:hypothetical protein
LAAVSFNPNNRPEEAMTEEEERKRLLERRYPRALGYWGVLKAFTPKACDEYRAEMVEAEKRLRELDSRRS